MTKTSETSWDAVEIADHIEEEEYITPDTRRECYIRDGWKCRKCGNEDFASLTLHHVMYRSHGGGHKAENLITLCWQCHRRVHDKRLWLIDVDGHWFFRDMDHWREQYRQGRLPRWKPVDVPSWRYGEIPNWRVKRRNEQGR